MTQSEILNGVVEILRDLMEGSTLAERVEIINGMKRELHALSPFSAEPVDCVLWFPSAKVIANDYNPNSVAPPEMKLLEVSILEDGYTQPVVGMNGGDNIETVDGFHRGRIGKESASVIKRTHGYLPVALINATRQDKADRIASTIRHNRARGKHKVEAMSDIVVELKRRNWSDDRIGRELGMDKDEILRLCQITGLSELFSDQEFSKSWDVEGSITEEDFVALTDEIETFDEDAKACRTVNTSDENRVFHTYEKWECYKAGFYNTTHPTLSKAQCEEAYREFLSDLPKFESALNSVIEEWKHSCEHYLTNVSMNRIAWLGQASACYALGIPSAFRSGFSMMTSAGQGEADGLALKYLNHWLTANEIDPVTMDEAYSGDRQSDIY